MDFRDCMDVRCKEMIIWEVVGLLEIGAIDDFLANNIFLKLLNKPNYVSREEMGRGNDCDI